MGSYEFVSSTCCFDRVPGDNLIHVVFYFPAYLCFAPNLQGRKLFSLTFRLMTIVIFRVSHELHFSACLIVQVILQLVCARFGTIFDFFVGTIRKFRRTVTRRILVSVLQRLFSMVGCTSSAALAVVDATSDERCPGNFLKINNVQTTSNI